MYDIDILCNPHRVDYVQIYYIYTFTHTDIFQPVIILIMC